MTITLPSSSPIRLTDVLGDPERAARQLLEDVCGLMAVSSSADASMVVYALDLDPWPAMAVAAYPRERLGVLVHRDGRIFSTPQASAGRDWLHRYPREASVMEELCLWYPRDPRELRWEWEDGLAAYVTIAHRHLMAEEHWRRTGRWPFEDAPHGPGDHRIKDGRLLRRLGDWWRP